MSALVVVNFTTASTTATYDTANITAPDDVHYLTAAATGVTFQVTPHEPRER
ncbi:MAG: hypothetical protein ABIR39_12170 [Nocardioides sp.]|uniref:hypothetical protein n=1 Tax=Nocardioides sp. TaxID=35761 RepID=UPI003266F889